MKWSLLINSLLVAVAATGLAGLLGCVVAGAMAFSRGFLKTIGLLVCIAVLALPPFMVAGAWLDLFGNAGLLKAWIPGSLYSIPATALLLSFLFWPIPALFVYGSLQQLDRAYCDAEPAAKGWSFFRFILWPKIAPSFSLSCWIVFVLSLNQFSVPALLQTKVLPAQLYVSFNTSFNYQEAAVRSLPLIIAPLFLLVWILWRTPRWDWPRLTETVPGLSLKRQLGGVYSSCLAFLSVLIVLISLFLPLMEVMFSPRTWRELPGAFQAGTLPLWNSFWYSAATATLGVGLGWISWKQKWLVWSWLAFLVPGVFLGVAFIYLFNRDWTSFFYQSTGLLVFALLFRYFAPGRQIAVLARRSLDPDLADAAHLEGARGWRRWWSVDAPQAGPLLAAAWYVVYLLCLWDVETLVLLNQPGGETLAARVFGFLHYGHNDQVNALCIMLLGLAAIPWVAWLLGRELFHRFRPALVLPAATMTVVLAGCGGDVEGTLSEEKKALRSQFFSHVEVIGSRGTGAGRFNKPRSLALDREDNLYVVDLTGRVQKFSPEGKYMGGWQMPELERGRPKGMCRDAQGRIVVVEPHYLRVNHFLPDGNLNLQWGEPGEAPGKLAFPRSAACAPNGEIFVSEYSKVERIQRFEEPGGRLLNVIGHAGTGPGEFNRPEGVCLDEQGLLVVADSCNHRLQVFTPEGDFVELFGEAGQAAGQLSYPFDVRVDSRGWLFVCEYGNSRIQIFNPQHKSVEIIGGHGTAPGQFHNPWAIALDSRGNLYVADAQNHRVQKLVRKGAPVPPVQQGLVSHSAPPGEPEKRVRN